MGVPPVIIHFKGIVPYKPAIGVPPRHPMTMEPPISGYSTLQHLPTSMVLLQWQQMRDLATLGALLCCHWPLAASSAAPECLAFLRTAWRKTLMFDGKIDGFQSIDSTDSAENARGKKTCQGLEFIWVITYAEGFRA